MRGCIFADVLAAILWPVLLLACFAKLASAADLNLAADFDIEPQPLDSALIEFSEQGNIQLMVATEVVDGLLSPGVSGRYSKKDALRLLIGANPLRFQAVGDHTIAVSRAGDAPQDLQQVIRDDSGGLFAADDPQSSEPDRPLRRGGSTLFDDFRNARDEIVVTGLRGKPRSIADSPAPIDIISSTALERSGRPGVLHALQFLVPSFHLPARAGGSTSTVIATGGLRGLNPDQTLVLVNGRRRHTTSLINAVGLLYNGSVPADLDHIPISAIERIEILRDGASAQYGSDAIAGVINIILKDGGSGGSIKVSGGQNFDRGDGEQREIAGNAGFGLGAEGFLNVSASLRDQAASNRAEPIAADFPLYYPLPDGSPDPREQTADRMVTRNFGVFPSTTRSLAVNAALPLSQRGMELYAFGTLSDRQSVLNWSYREPNSPNNIDAVYPDGFRPRLNIDESDVELALGARGETAGWAWDAASVYGRNHAERHARNTINASLGPASPTRFYVGKLESRDWVNSLDLTRSIDFGRGDLQVSWGAQHHREYYRIEPGDPPSYAAGNWVFPEGHPRAGEAPAPAAQANHGITPDDASDARRDSLALYGEFGWSPAPRAFLGLAARFEDFDDSVGSSLVGKFSFRYSFSDRFAMRLTTSSGFRAPPLAQQQYASTTSQFRDLDGDTVDDLLLIKQLPPESAAARALGAVPLTPEESLNLSAGLTFRPWDSLSVTVDAYRIDLDDRISITSTLSGPEISAILAASGLSPSLSGQYYTNAIDTRTSGIDIVASWAREFGRAGSLAFSLGYNANSTRIVRVAANPPELEALGPDFVLFDRIRRGHLTYGLPDSKTVLSINWLIDAFDTSVRVARFGEYRSVSNSKDAEFRIGAETVVDLDLSYGFEDRWFITAGANNLFNAYPDRIREPSERRGSGQYDTRGGFGFTGGSYFLRLDYLF